MVHNCPVSKMTDDIRDNWHSRRTNAVSSFRVFLSETNWPHCYFDSPAAIPSPMGMCTSEWRIVFANPNSWFRWWWLCRFGVSTMSLALNVVFVICRWHVRDQCWNSVMHRWVWQVWAANDLRRPYPYRWPLAIVWIVVVAMYYRVLRFAWDSIGHFVLCRIMAVQDLSRVLVRWQWAVSFRAEWQVFDYRQWQLYSGFYHRNVVAPNRWLEFSIRENVADRRWSPRFVDWMFRMVARDRSVVPDNSVRLRSVRMVRVLRKDSTTVWLPDQWICPMQVWMRPAYLVLIISDCRCDYQLLIR